MIYFEDLNVLEEVQNAAASSNWSFKIIAQRCIDYDGVYWRGKITLAKPNDNCICSSYTIVTADSLEELQIWCDLHMLNIDDVRKMNLDSIC